MIKLKFDANNGTVDLYRDKVIITTLGPEDFGSLIQEIKRIMEEASPSIKKKQEWKRERKHLITQLKILVTVRLIEFLRKIKGYWANIKAYFKIINQ